MAIERLSPLLTLKPWQSLFLGSPKLLNLCFSQYLLSKDRYSYPAGPSGEQMRLSVLRMPLLRVRNGTVAHTGKNYALPKLLASSAKRKDPANRSGLIMGNR